MKIYQLARFLSEPKKPQKPYLIAGLGNPGRKYVDTRHNVGFEMLDSVAAAFGIKVSKVKFRALIGYGTIGGEDVILAKPQTYMNVSGESIRDIAEYYKIPAERIIIISDDISLDTGRVRIRQKGSAGGHNGLKSIIYQLNSDEFPRIRVGIGSPEGDGLVGYVLERFSKDEIRALTELAIAMPTIVETIITKGIAEAMNRYNSKNRNDS
ncbi:MAG: Peptidyl-tRNA hydrolase [Firmicutes bacterium ADurb.Bin193]|nr:MAG: Peptidyl-tRNA hydrolase [Firmicutes bacterium ADurb.Bin193]